MYVHLLRLFTVYARPITFLTERDYIPKQKHTLKKNNS